MNFPDFGGFGVETSTLYRERRCRVQSTQKNQNIACCFANSDLLIW